jgi:hypothetical protein
MRHLSVLAIAAAVGGLAMPAAAADPAPKTRKVCKAVNNGNPLFPTMRCRTVDVEPAATAVAPVAVAAAPAVAPAAGAQVAANGAQPQ